MEANQQIIKLQGYTVLEQVYSPGRTICFRAVRMSDQKKVILKLLRSEYPTTTELASLQQDYQLTKQLALPGVIEAYDFQKYENGFSLILEDTGGITLKQFMEQNVVTLSMFFKVAIQLVDTVSALHRNQVIHKDINPSNIIINPHTLEIKLADLSHASLLQYEIQEVQNPNLLETSLCYMSPEQTGRMNRSVDYRTDLYSMGITFYEMLARCLPFQATDALGWVYCHIAESPLLLTKATANIPEMIARIVHKLINKMPEDRYQSASGLKADLVLCADEWQEHESISDFELAQNDVRETLQISQKLYGRQTQVTELLAAFQRVTEGAKEGILITGNAGIGKTSLVQEIHKPITRKKGFLVRGKFDPLKRNIPFSAIIDAFSELVQHWISEPEEKLIPIRNELLAAFGNSGQVLIDIIPDIELIIGKQPQAPTLNPTQAQNRFMILFRGFLQAFAKKNHPLVIFLDDLQWVDSGSLKLIETILLDSGIEYLLLIGSYRDNEVSIDHPLTITLHDLNKANAAITSLNLEVLKQNDIEQLMMDTLNSNAEDSKALANLVVRKTGGNPFFISKLLRILNQDKLLNFSHEHKKWEWDIALLEQIEITDSIVELLVNNIHKLSKPTQKTITLAACIGNTFDLGILSNLCEQTVKQTAMQIWEAIHADLIIPTGETYKHVGLLNVQDTSTDSLKERINYKFSHDRIQQAAYSLSSETMRQNTHLRIAKILLKKYRAVEDGVDFFEMLNHFSQCLPLITDRDEQIEVAELNLLGAKKARLSTAYQAAIIYLQCGIALLKNESWQDQYNLLFCLHNQLLECEYLTGDFDAAQEHFEMLMQKAQTTLTKANLYYSKIKLYTNQGKLEEGCEIGLKALELFNIKIKKQPSILSIIWSILKVQWRTLFKPIKNLDLPEMTDPEQLSIVQISFAIGTAASAFNRRLFLKTTCMTTNMVLTYGYTDEAPLALCAYAMLLMNLGRHKKAMEFLSLGRKVGEKCGTAVASSRYNVPALIINYQYYPIPMTLDLAKKAYQTALESGELIYAAWSYLAKIRALNLMGTPIPEMIHETETAYEYVNRIKYTDYISIVKIYLLYFQTLSHSSPHQSDLLAALDEIKKVENKIVYAEGHSILARYYFIMGKYSDAIRMAEKAIEVEQHYRHHMLVRCELYYFYALSLAAAYSDAGFAKKEYKKRIKKICNYLRKWATLSEYNFKDRYLLILAELCRISGDHTKAARYYDDAIDAAQKNGFIYCLAVANECAAQFYFESKKPKIAKSYLVDAYYYYYRWQAFAKTSQLEKLHSDWFKSQRPESQTDNQQDSLQTLGTSTLNFASVFKASQAISGEIRLEQLMQKIVNVAVENAGAEKAWLLTKHANHLVIQVEMDKAKKSVSFPRQQFSPDNRELPHAIINSVVRYGKAIILNDATNDTNFMNDAYINKNQPKSILCMPIISHQELIGLLYLENNLTTEAFTQEHLKILNLIASQAAISFENALVYAATGRFVPHEFLQTLHKRNIAEVTLGDNIHKNMSILFCDIRGFTSLSEKLTSGETFELINSFFTCMEPIISAQHGFIDKYIGDAIMALFDGVTDNAVRAAVEMLKTLVQYQKDSLAAGKPSIKIGIGINTGELMLGIVGSQDRIESTVIGDSVNIATRIESLNKIYGTSLLISNTSCHMIRYPEHFHLRLIDSTKVKGKEIPIDIWEVYDADPIEVLKGKDATLQLFDTARKNYNQKNWQKALQLFGECLEINPQDSVARYFLKACQQKLKSKNPDAIKINRS